MPSKILLSTLVLIMACSTPQKSFEKQNYSRAFDLSLAELRRDKSVSQNTAILSKSLNEMIKNGLMEGDQLRYNGTLKDKDRVLNSYEDLQQKIRNAEPFLGSDYATQYELLQKNALDLQEELYQTYLQSGLDKLDQAINQERKSLAQEAYRDFQDAKNYTAFPAEADSLMDVAYENGVMYYYVEASAPFALMEEWDIDRRFDDVEDYQGNFQKIYFEKNQANIDCILEVRFGSLDVSTSERTDRQDYNQQVIDGYNTRTDTSGQVIEEPIYKNVAGTVFTKTRVKTLSWQANVSVQASTNNCNLSDASFGAETSSEIIEVSWDGDERVIPDEYKSPTSTSFEDEDDMTDELIDDIFRKFVAHYF